jgi:hypothetical protein
MKRTTTIKVKGSENGKTRNPQILLSAESYNEYLVFSDGSQESSLASFKDSEDGKFD